jgi:type II secretory pathway pseudopilin PulG
MAMNKKTKDKKQKTGSQKGISIVELLIVCFIIGVALTSLLGLATFSLKVSQKIKENGEALFLAEQAMEATRAIARADWSELTNGYHGLNSGLAGYWAFEGSYSVINNKYTRKILIEDVYRDNTPTDSEETDEIETDGIIESLDYLDPDTKKITVFVSWDNKEIKLITYLTNWSQ